MRLDAGTASSFARLTLGHLEQQWPYKMDLVLAGPEDAKTPIEFHPIFHGSFDWHSCVHGWWQVMTILRLFPDLPEAAAIRAKADRMLTAEKAAGELAFLARPNAAGFERPYGWGWLLSLHAELARHEGPWAAALEPLARTFADRFKAHLPKLTYPIRVGTHFNTAFALIHAQGWALAHDAELAALIEDRAYAWFGGDRDCRAFGEPGGDEFLSSSLTEALLMARLLTQAALRDWFAAFLPEIPEALRIPAHVSDRSDGKIAHLDGLNLSRAWCWRGIATALGGNQAMQELANTHLKAALPHLDDHYMGTHWLASFALLALLEP